MAAVAMLKAPRARDLPSAPVCASPRRGPRCPPPPQDSAAGLTLTRRRHCADPPAGTSLASSGGGRSLPGSLPASASSLLPTLHCQLHGGLSNLCTVRRGPAAPAPALRAPLPLPVCSAPRGGRLAELTRARLAARLPGGAAGSRGEETPLPLPLESCSLEPPENASPAPNGLSLCDAVLLVSSQLLVCYSEGSKTRR